MGTTFYFYAVTIFTPDDNVLAFFTEEVVYSMLIFEWVTVAQSQTKIFFANAPPTQTQADYLLLLLKAVHTNFIILGFIRSIYRTQDEPANHYDTDLLNNIINLTLLSDI